MRYHYIPIRMMKIKNSKAPNADNDAARPDYSYIAGENLTVHSGKWFGGYHKIKYVATMPPSNCTLIDMYGELQSAMQLKSLSENKFKENKRKSKGFGNYLDRHINDGKVH